MFIPLDYYRILGVPIQATDEQISQAYHDREWQKPRREYSEMAIAARIKLLASAYEVLSSPEKRLEYDTSFLPTQPTDILTEDLAQPVEQDLSVEIPKEPLSTSPTIDIPPEQFVGALLILQELGEYELVLRSGISYLNSPEFASLKDERSNRVQLTIKEDIILTLALAYLELGREQWQKGEYENAAMSGEMGYNLLVDDNLCPSVQSEIETDLYKLRPYRILELLAQGEHKPAQKTKAFQLLKEMLKQRQGIEGQGEDHSGLNFEQFLCFIQQLRQYLSAAEQQELFEAEAQRPSSVATYLAIYTQIATGFASKQPQLLVRAQQMLKTLGKREDVHWEQAMCALLLGQTQEANLALQQSQEQKILELVKQHSQDSPDLLPGLCFYGEKWLHQEVLPQFYDLANCKLTLKEYFADEKVQAYLENLYPTAKLQRSHNKFKSESQTFRKEKSKRRSFFSWGKKQSAEPRKATAKVTQYQLVQSKELVGAGTGYRNGSTATLPRIDSSSNKGGTSLKTPTSPVLGQGKNRSTYEQSLGNSLKINPSSSSRQIPRGTTSYHRSLARKNKRSGLFSPALRRALFFIAMIWGIGILGFVFTKMMLNSSVKQASQSEKLLIKLNESPIQLPSVEQFSQSVINEDMTEARAKQTINKWLESKSAAFGSEHKIDALDTILASSLLSIWRERALHYRQTREYREYQHEIKVTSVNFDPQKPNQAIIEAQVKEKAQHYQGGNLNQAKSYDDNLLVRYHLIRQGNKWLIQKSAVIKTF